jgi:hypothetical protein
VKAYPEKHQQGFISVENLELIVGENNIPRSFGIKGDLGVQIAEDGRIWVCINGIAFMRFSPHPDGKMKKEAK